ETDSRMNTPSTLGGNWAWRLRANEIDDIIKGRLSEMTDLYDRTHFVHPPEPIPGAPSGGLR
ncbi:MAG TPA: hypothetical protein VMW69_04920, partial [Spirochaetia bacterium]|nr:hypothetical protein [Spirochaetia bacterium]